MSDNTIALLTKHGKEQQIEPALTPLGWRFEVTSQFDTDTLGTFGGEITRTLDPLACAQQKARLACDITQSEFGLGSEGSFFPSPYGFGTSNLEIVACVDRAGNALAYGVYEAPFPAQSAALSNPDDSHLDKYLDALPPHQGSMIMVDNVAVAKGLMTADDIRNVITKLDKVCFKQAVELTFDLRAHLCPARQLHIEKAAQNLVEKLQSHCPQCNHRGFWPEQAVDGLPCEVCTLPTRVIKKHIAICNHCGYEKDFPVEAKTASAQYCDFCNP